MLQIKELDMTDGFFWGGINSKRFCKYFLRNFWLVIAIMITTYLGLSLVDNLTYTPSYTSTAIAAVYPRSSSYRYHTIETVWDLSSKTADISSVFNSDMFQSALHNQDLSLQDCAVDSSHIDSTDLLVIHATSSNPETAFKGIRAALDYYSRFSGDMTGSPEIRIILGPEAPELVTGSSKIQKYRSFLCIFSGLMMSGLLLLIYTSRKTYKTERQIRRHYEDVRFFSLPFIESGSEYKKGIFSKQNCQEPMKKLALEIKQVLHKCSKHSLLVASNSDKAGGAAIISALARELAKQDEHVILIGTESPQHGGASGTGSLDGTGKNTLPDILQRKCTVKDAMLYSEELNAYYIPCSADGLDENMSYSIDDARRVLLDCQEYADIVLVNGAAWHPARGAQIWQAAADAAIALYRQDDADFFEADKMLSDLQNGNTYFAGCILFGF